MQQHYQVAGLQEHPRPQAHTPAPLLCRWISTFACLVALLGGSAGWSAPVRLDFNELPPDPPWEVINNGGTASVANGVLTIRTQSYYSLLYGLLWVSGISTWTIAAAG